MQPTITRIPLRLIDLMQPTILFHLETDDVDLFLFYSEEKQWCNKRLSLHPAELIQIRSMQWIVDRVGIERCQKGNSCPFNTTKKALDELNSSYKQQITNCVFLLSII